MASTKIINVLKDDGFEEILNIFKDSPAKEVIFVLPKSSRSFKEEEHFMVLNHEARKAEKSVSILCSNPAINALAKKYDFDVLITEEIGHKKTKPLITAVNQIDDVNFYDEENGKEKDKEDEEKDKDKEIGEEEEEEGEEEEKGETESRIEEGIGTTENSGKNDYQIIGAAARQNLSDVLRPHGPTAKNLKISASREKPASVDVKKAIGSTKSLIDLEGVWQRQEFKSRDTATKSDSDEKPVRFKIKRFRLKPLSRGRKITIIVCVAIVVVMGVIFYTAAGTAKIAIIPQKKSLNFQIKVASSDRYSNVDTAFNKIPGQLFTIQKTVSKTFESTGQKDVAQKARGKLTVYNQLTQNQPLIATTRFQSENGLIFRTLKTITVPAAKNSSTPGTIEVEVVADKSGQEYNIAAGKFTVPAFKEKNDTERYQKIYGQSNESMRGGTNGKAKVVAEADFTKAKEELTAQLEKEVSDEVKTQTQGLRVVNVATAQATAPQSTAQIDEPVDNFTMTITGTLSTIGFKDSDLNQLIESYVAKTNNLVTIPSKTEISFINAKFSKVENNSGLLEFSAVVKGDGFAKIDDQKIIQDLLGKNEDEIKSYLEKTTGVDSAKVLLSPFWVSKMPKDKTNVSLEIKYE